MKFILLAALAIPLAHSHPVFIGTGANGIYLSDFDAEAGTLTKPILAVEYQRPGFLALHPGKPILLAVGGDNMVASFSIGKNSSLALLGDASSGGNGPCHLAVDATGQTVAVANYGDGSTTTIRLDDKGKPGKIVSMIRSEGSGPNEQRQDGPHAHGTYFDSSNQFLYVPDLGSDKVLIHRFDPATSELKLNDPSALQATPGAGPRHMAFSPDGKHAYVINELDNTVIATAFDGSTGGLTSIASYPTLPENFEGQNTTAEIEVHPNGNFVYGSNRGHDSIVVYTRNSESGKLTLLQHAPCGGSTPRHFKIDPSGFWLLCGLLKDNKVAVLPLDPDSGLLGAPKAVVNVPAPTCLLFQ